MTNFFLKQAHLNDISHILSHMRPQDQKEVFATEFDNDIRRIALKYKQSCEINMVFCHEDGDPIALLAGSRLWPHTAQIGFIATHRWEDIALSVSKSLKNIKNSWLEAQDIRQLLCFAISEYEENIRWMNWLGFEEKARISHMGKNGEDLSLMIYNLEN